MKIQFTKTVWLLGFISLFADISSELLYPVLPVYLKNAGYSMLAIGILEGLANVVAGLSKGYFGHKSDTMKSRTVFIRWGYGCSALGKLLMVGAPDLMRIFTARMTDRLGKGIRTAPRDAMLAGEAGPENRGVVFGFHRGLDTLGAAIGPALGMLWLHYHPGDYSTLFTLAFIPAAISFFITMFIKDKSSVPPAVRKQQVGFFSYFKYWKTGPASFRKLILPLLLLALVNSPDVFLLMALKEAGFTDTAMIGVYVLYNFSYAMLATPAGRIADRVGKIKVLSAGMLLFTITYAGMAGLNGWPVFILLFLIYAAAMSCLESVAKAYISDIAPPDQRGQAIGFYTSASSLSILFAGVWTGLLWPYGGPSLVFSITAFVASCSLLLLYKNSRNLYMKSEGNG
jgi:MFS family permease